MNVRLYVTALLKGANMQFPILKQLVYVYIFPIRFAVY